MSDFSYLLIKRIEVKNVNALTHYLVTNGPSVNASVGMAHAICRLSEYGIEDFRGVALIHHDSSLQAEYDRFGKALPIQRRGASYINRKDYASSCKDGTNISLSLQPTVTRHEIISLVLRFDREHDLDEQQIKSFLRGGRFAGGQIQRYAGVSFHDSMIDVQRHLGSGFAVKDKTDLVTASMLKTSHEPHHVLLDYLHSYSEQITAAAIDAVSHAQCHWQQIKANKDIDEQLSKRIATKFSDVLDSLGTLQSSSGTENDNNLPPLKLLARFSKQLCDHLSNVTLLTEQLEHCIAPIKNCIADFSWLSATSLGYALIKEPTERANARGGYPHAFAEPLLGLVQYKFIHQADNTELPFWQGKWQDAHTFILTTQV